jgi:hypothetical protein
VANGVSEAVEGDDLVTRRVATEGPAGPDPAVAMQEEEEEEKRPEPSEGEDEDTCDTLACGLD